VAAMLEVAMRHILLIFVGYVKIKTLIMSVQLAIPSIKQFFFMGP